MADSYDEPVIFLIEALDIESRAAPDEAAHGEAVKARSLPPRLLIRLGGRSRTVMRQEGEQSGEVNSRPLVSVKA